MLVLALQFSKGDASVGIVRTRSPDTLWQRSSTLVPCEKGCTLTGQLPQNGREDKVRRFEM
jgi:hypothetical protein